MAKKRKASAGKRKDLLKKDKPVADNLSYEKKVDMFATVVNPKTKEKKVQTSKPITPDSHVQFVRARPKTAINERER